MRTLSTCAALVFIGSAFGTEPADERTKKLLQSENYTVTWRTAPVYESDAVLEIGDGNGHGGTLGWLRLHPSEDGVDVLSVELDKRRQPYKLKWPPDRAPVVIKRGRLKGDAYIDLLHDLAVVNAAKLTPVAHDQYTSSSNDFWVYARLTATGKTLVDLDWAGYEGSSAELEFAKSHASVRLARNSIKELDFKDHKLTDDERTWASQKFTRDWKRFKGLDFHWWVRERYIQTIGVVGNEAAIPMLREILAVEPPHGQRREASDERCVYYAINAVTRLTKQDVRDKPLEEMDIEKTRLKVLDLIKVVK